MNDTHDIEQTVAHRPWPLPDEPWIMYQSWQDQLFAHWPILPEDLRPHVPPPLALDMFEGRCWIGVTPFRIADLHARGLPALPIASEFPELNLRTYVHYGGKHGVYFFSLDAASQLAVLGARTLFGLPYHHADMNVAARGGWIEYDSKRRERNHAAFNARYRAQGDAFHAEPGTLEHFLIERYALFVVDEDGNTMRGDIHHKPWQLYHAEAMIQRNTIVTAQGIEQSEKEPLLHFSARQDALIWRPVTAG